MRSWFKRLCLLSLLAVLPLLGLPQPGSAAALRVLVDTSTEMPLAGLDSRGRLVAGLHLELGRLLAQRLQREPEFLLLPRKRLVVALQAGQADLICLYMPEWLGGELDWSQPVLTTQELIVTRSDAPRPPDMAALAGQAIGTVHGFVYPELERLLGSGFVREDAPDAAAALRKLALGRSRHAVVNELLLRHLHRSGQLAPGLLHPPLTMASYPTRCGLSRRSGLSLAALDRAIAGLQADGSLARLLARYQRER